MTAESSTSDSVTYELVDEYQFATKATILGGCLGAGVALAIDGPIVGRALLGGLLTAIVAGGLYWTLLALADRLTGGTRNRRLEFPRPPVRGQNGRATADGGRSSDRRSTDDE